MSVLVQKQEAVSAPGGDAGRIVQGGLAGGLPGEEIRGALLLPLGLHLRLPHRDHRLLRRGRPVRGAGHATAGLLGGQPLHAPRLVEHAADQGRPGRHQVSPGRRPEQADRGRLQRAAGGRRRLRGLFLIDKEGVVRHQVVNDLPLGRNVEEVLRMVKALQFVEAHGEVCPANWQEGKATIKPNPKGSQEFFAKQYDNDIRRAMRHCGSEPGRVHPAGSSGPTRPGSDLSCCILSLSVNNYTRGC